MVLWAMRMLWDGVKLLIYRYEIECEKCPNKSVCTYDSWDENNYCPVKFTGDEKHDKYIEELIDDVEKTEVL